MIEKMSKTLDKRDLYLLYPGEQKGLGILEEAKRWAAKQPTIELSGEDARLFALLLSKPDPLDEDE